MENTKVEITLDKPVVICQGPEGLSGHTVNAGHIKFPDIERTGSGALHVTVISAADGFGAYGLHGREHFISTDEGRSFQQIKDETDNLGRSLEFDKRPKDGGIGLSDGSRIRERQVISFDPALVSHVKPFMSAKDFYHPSAWAYKGEDIMPAYGGYPVERLLPGKTEWRLDYKHVKIPGELRLSAFGSFYPQFFWRFRCGPDGRIWGLTYPFILEEDGQIRDMPVFLVSDDRGESFSYLSKISPLLMARKNGEPVPAHLQEPDIAFMPDGSIICIMRSGSPRPSYISRSTDNGKTWSAPEYFDELGVWPTLLSLKNGVTLVSYGRPGVFIRATTDPSGMNWDERVTVVPKSPYGEENSCCYTGMAALGDDEVLLVYSYYFYLNERSVPVKTILARRVHTRILWRKT
jgi:hypothetical protein